MDITCNLKTLNRFRSKSKAEIQRIRHAFRFTTAQVDALVNIYVKLLEQQGPLAKQISRTQFQSVLFECFDMPDEFMFSRIMTAANAGTSNYMSLTIFFRVFNIFLRATFEERCRFCFAAYDTIGENIIRPLNLAVFLRGSVYAPTKEDAEEIIKELTDTIMKKLDVDMDGAISFKDYMDTMKKYPDLMEILGVCLPSRKVVNAFLTTFTSDIPKY